MKRLKLRRSIIHAVYLRDVNVVIEFMASKGCEVLPIDAYEAWRSYGEDNFCAGWVSASQENLEEFFNQRDRYFYEEEAK